MDIQVTVDGLSEVVARLERRGDLAPGVMRQATERAVLYVHGRVPPYPPPPPDSRYVRTGTLGRSITTEVRDVGSATVGVIGTAVVYAPWVISAKEVGGRGPQAWMHRGRWWTLHEVVERARDGIVRIYQDALRAWLK